MKISTCLSTNPAKFDAVPFKGNFDENVADISEMGFDGIELAVRDPRIINQEKTIDTITGAGMKIPAVGTGQAWGEEGLSFTDPDADVRKQAVHRVYSHLDFSGKADSIVIIGLLRGITRDGVSEKQANEWMYECFSDCCERAAERDVRIAFEPINRFETSLLNTVEEGLEFIERVGGKHLGMLLDSFHMNIEEPSMEESIRAAGDRIFHFHYADSNRWYPGAGHIDFKSVLKALYSTGYDGYISGEHLPDPEPKFAAKAGLDFLRNMDREYNF
jgi:5-keto-L-gluconate epimerase